MEANRKSQKLFFFVKTGGGGDEDVLKQLKEKEFSISGSKFFPRRIVSCGKGITYQGIKN